MAAYQYLGMPGITWECLQAVRLILTGGGYFNRDGREMIPSAATLVTKRQNDPKEPGAHAFIFWEWILTCTVVPSGFSSGYHGEGPRGLAYALLMIESKGIPFYELKVEEDLFERLDGNRLTDDDLEFLDHHGRSRYVRVSDYTDSSLSDSDPVKYSRIYDDYLPFLEGDSTPRIDWEWLDREIAEKCEALAATDLRSALARAFLILKNRLSSAFELGDNLDGEDLVNKIFGTNGILASTATDDAKKKENLALRDLLAGLFKVFRNKYSHADVIPPWYEAQAVLLMMTFALTHLDLLESNNRRVAYRSERFIR